ncbi:hypothetical protein WA026_001653 [Henosepilachna vigintioctopunctata]|uniref:lysozyme n=1 Tax=Henosepilachna vigintioctopunctata TaxID=420089 RepID=A0AAW1USK6_9CUCU
MKLLHLLFVFLVLIAYGEALKNLIGTPIQKCVNCLCHARSGCWSRFNCAKYSVGFEYWKTAGSPVLNVDDDPDAESSYKMCMANENCIVNTIAQYTSKFGEMDCNCDGKFDCKDRFAIHLQGANCANPNFGSRYARRFNECAASTGVADMLSSEGNGNCEVESV